MSRDKKPTRYAAILADIFLSKYEDGQQEVAFERPDLVTSSNRLDIELPKNLGDIIYSFRHRVPLPDEITQTAPEGQSWIIRSKGRAKYAFELAKASNIVPSQGRIKIKLPDSTPELILANSLEDEQALLALVRYNRLVDIFMGVNAYSLQNHLRTTVKGIGQVEVDEIYLAVDRFGTQYVVPVQAKGGNDRIGVIQVEQDLAMCAEKFPNFVARALACQFLGDNTVVMFELGMQDEELVILDEEHYKLVPAEQISVEDLEHYRIKSGETPNGPDL